jgi:hypothetical protein
VGFRAAAQEVWGKTGLQAIASRLDPETRAATFDPLVISRDWLPERFAIAWHDAAWEGPAGRRSADYLTFIDRMLDNGFGRVQKFFLESATPHAILQKGADLWRHDHTTGTLSVERKGQNEAVVTLRDHVYITTPLCRLTVAEIYRYALSLSLVDEALVSHTSNGASELVCRLSWR